MVLILRPLAYHGHLHLCQFLLHVVCEEVASLSTDSLLSIVEKFTFFFFVDWNPLGVPTDEPTDLVYYKSIK
jgi:hypothetical protein